MKNILSYLFIFLLCSIGVAQKKQNHFVVFGGTAHLGNGKIIENAVIAVNNGTFEMVGSAKGLKLNPASYDTVYYVEGKHIYPGLINPNNVLGLHDAESVRATRDFSEIGHINPHIRTLIAYNTDNAIIPTIKTNGILYTQCTPRSGLISGSSSIMALEGWNWEDAVLKADDGIHLNLPQMSSARPEKEGEQGSPASKKYTDDKNYMEKFFMDALAYAHSSSNQEKNIRFEAMRGIFTGKSNLYIHTEKARDILVAIDLVKNYGIKKAVIVGGKESYKVTKELKKNKIPVMLSRVHDLPDRADEAVDLMYSLPALLQKDSVLFCLQLEGDMEAAQSRNLPFNAGTAIAYGLTKEEALASVTLNAAKIIGIDNKVGSLEDGKLASFIISEGDLFDIRTNNIQFAWIAGKKVDLNNKQTELYNRYKTKYGIK
ncbi:MAG TPA: amidohydrolase family protein [Bacteroidia bacterium]|nr:amidohydrolase family protein [Bacteroidia bacterium]